MNCMEIQGYKVPSKRYSLADLDEETLFPIDVIETADYFVIPHYSNSTELSSLQMSILIPRALPYKIFEKHGKLYIDIRDFIFNYHNDFSDSDCPKNLLEANLLFGDYSEKSKFGRIFTLKRPTKARHVLYIPNNYECELSQDKLTTLKLESAHLVSRFIQSTDKGIMISRPFTVLKTNQYLDNSYSVHTANDLHSFYVFIQNKRERELLEKIGIGTTRAAIEKAKIIEQNKISAQNRPLFLNRLDSLNQEIADLEKNPNVYSHVLPHLQYDNPISFSYRISERHDEHQQSGGGYYTEENIRTAEIDIRNNLEEIRSSVAKINSTIKILEELMAPELAKLRKIRVFLVRPDRNNSGIHLMHHNPYPVEFVASYELMSGFQYQKELLTISAEDLAQKIIDKFRPRIEEKLYTIKTIEKINRVARAYNRDNPDIAKKNPQLSPETIIFSR